MADRSGLHILMVLPFLHGRCAGRPWVRLGICRLPALRYPGSRCLAPVMQPAFLLLFLLPPPAAGALRLAPAIARVHGAQPIEAKPLACRGLIGMLFSAAKFRTASRVQSKNG